jgi:hypothetical protein
VTALLAVGLVIALRRLSDAQVRLERTRGPSGAVLTDGIESPFAAMDASEFAHQWEEAVPPMDS